ncbi:MAG TPA: aminomethyltransferase beta-barrel domain-containing protein, partial [Caldimonas sp.]
AKSRYRQADAACTLGREGDEPASIELTFARPQWAVTPGQSAVLYAGDVCLGGGVIVGSGEGTAYSAVPSREEESHTP